MKIAEFPGYYRNEIMLHSSPDSTGNDKYQIRLNSLCVEVNVYRGPKETVLTLKIQQHKYPVLHGIDYKKRLNRFLPEQITVSTVYITGGGMHGFR
ncbi:hypothetical protein [Methanolacinia petrolearia]|uniref:hypothetical protein n=1 Tax=Methanolacinia petrolearia TaxID=54120 RepID=UPI003BA97348